MALGDRLNFGPLRQRQIFGMPEQIQEQPIDFGFEPSPTFPTMGARPNITAPSMIQPNPDDFDMAARFRQLYDPETVATERLTDLLGQFPQRGERGTLRKIGASLMGLRNVGKKNVTPQDLAATMQMQDIFVDRPFFEGREDWLTQMEPTTKAADLERRANIEQRTMANQIISQELAERKVRETERKNRADEQIRQQRADVYEFRSRNPNAKIIAPRGGNIRAIDPISGRVIADFGPTGQMSDSDRLELEHEYTMAEIGARTAGQKEVKETPSGGKGGREGELPTQTKVREYTAARRLFNEKPEYQKFIRLGAPGTNDFTLRKPGGWGGPTEAQYKEMYESIYGKKETPPPSGRGAPPPAGNRPPPQAAAPTGKVRMRNKDGVVGMVPAGQVEAAKKQGYVVVK